MSDDTYTIMQQTAELALKSAHSSKVASTIVGKTKGGDPFTETLTNYHPESIKKEFGEHAKIGDASGTIHAEVATILLARRTNNADQYVTVTPCPNCAKDTTEAGIKRFFIDSEGFESDWYKRRSEYFINMSMPIFNHAGVPVYVIDRTNKTTELHELSDIPAAYKPEIENPLLNRKIKSRHITHDSFHEFIEKRKTIHGETPFAAAFARSALGDYRMLSAIAHPAVGYTTETLDQAEGKYSFILQPINRIMMACAKYGLKIENGYLFSSHVPTAREQVNMVGAELNTLHIGSKEQARDGNGIEAMSQLAEASIINYHSLEI